MRRRLGVRGRTEPRREGVPPVRWEGDNDPGNGGGSGADPGRVCGLASAAPEAREASGSNSSITASDVCNGVVRRGDIDAGAAKETDLRAGEVEDRRPRGDAFSMPGEAGDRLDMPSERGCLRRELAREGVVAAEGGELCRRDAGEGSEAVVAVVAATEVGNGDAGAGGRRPRSTRRAGELSIEGQS